MLDIKLKNRHNRNTVVTVLALALLAAATMAAFPWLNRRAQQFLKQTDQESFREDLFERWVSDLYEGCFVLYYEVQRENAGMAGEESMTVKMQNEEALPQGESAEPLYDPAEEILDRINAQFKTIRTVFDYCIFLEDGKYKKNTTKPLEDALSEPAQKDLSEFYTDYLQITFDVSGVASVKPLYVSRMDADALVKQFDMISSENMLLEEMGGEFNSSSQAAEKMPRNFRVVFGIPKTEAAMGYLQNADTYSGAKYTYYELSRAYADAGAGVLYFFMAAVIFALVFVMTSRKVRGEAAFERPGNCYLFEAALIGIVMLLAASESFAQMIWSVNDYRSFSDMNRTFWGGGMADMLLTYVVIFILYAGWYLCFRFLRPLFSLGLIGYLRQYSLICLGMSKAAKYFRKTKDEIHGIDFTSKSNRIILKIVAVNFAVLAVVSFLWFYGIFVLALYSVALFLLSVRFCGRIGEKYERLLDLMRRVSAGELNANIPDNLEMFEPMKEELAKIQSGLKRAVEKEVKSERMKTELITNVSHDLKTPLTAITTYIELLKNREITQKEHDSYVEILEKKAMRLKVLIEDLFEVSKASSRSIQLNLADVDVVSLLKQVGVEHMSKFEEGGLILRYDVPEQKVVARLDGMKTYRIFENLFVNVWKYAMPKSRVYIAVERSDNTVHITMKNISAEEITINPKELTERFVRGDASRNTEGSGLGLAIAKSFTEAQGGVFAVETDGDLFKVSISFSDSSVQIGKNVLQ